MLEFNDPMTSLLMIMIMMIIISLECTIFLQLDAYAYVGEGVSYGPLLMPCVRGGGGGLKYLVCFFCFFCVRTIWRID